MNIVYAPTAAATRRPPRTRPAAPRGVVMYRNDPDAAMSDHDVSTKATVAEKLASLLGYEFAGEHDAARPAGKVAPFFVPTDTLPTLASAQQLGIRGADDLFGGVVTHPFAATKVISHPVVRHDAAVPAGWPHALGRQMHKAVLPGYTVFTAADAREAAARLFERGTLRLKDPAGVGGVGQWVVGDGADLEARLGSFAPDRLAQHGLVLELNLQDVITHSVGLVQLGEHRLSYYGVQSTTRNAQGHEVYGGSQLFVVRGGFGHLLRRRLDTAVRDAIESALAYHRAALAAFPGMFASRCNYDVAQGRDDAGQSHCGVLEQSWRIGGASGAEVAALEAFAADPHLQLVEASTCERYGDDVVVPPGAWILYDGVDRRVGRLTKYATVGGSAAHGDD